MGNSLMAVRDIVINIKYIVVGGIIVLFLPEQASLSKTGLEKIDTYLTLSKIGCPVFKSAVIMPKENINQKLIDKLHTYFKTEQVTVRYQYFRPYHTPIQGGNRYELSLKAIYPLQTDNTLLWLLEPINRLRNDYGINLYFQHDECTIEIVGKGFDVSDLNRGQISPHQIIITELPIRKGLYDEWWKFLQYSFVSKEEYLRSQNRRIQKLSNTGHNASYNIFNMVYKPLPIEMLEKLLYYISAIYEYMQEKDYCVSCSISNGKYIFWDIQTPNGKKSIYGVK